MKGDTMNKMRKKIILATLFLFLCLPIFSKNKLSVVQAEEATIIDVSWSNDELETAAAASGGKFNVDNTVVSNVPASVITLNSGDICITGACHVYDLINPLSRRFVISSSFSGSLTLKNVSIYRPNGDSPLKLQQGANLSLFLAGENFVEGDVRAGIHVPNGATLIIEDDLSTEGVGTLQTQSGSGAGIGGNYGSEDCGTVVINSGRITARSTGFSAAIGGCNTGNGGNVTINGGYVTAYDWGGSNAGIGGGYRGNGGTVTINGGFVSASSSYENRGIGFDIGRGQGGTDDGTLTITGGSFYPVNGKIPTGKNTNDGKGNRVYPVTIPNPHSIYETSLRTGLEVSIGEYQAATVASDEDHYQLPQDMSACVWLPYGQYSGVTIGEYHVGFAFVANAAAEINWTGYAINDETVDYGEVSPLVDGTVVGEGVVGDIITVRENPEENCVYVADSLKVTSASNPNGITLTATQMPGEYTFVMPEEEVTTSATFIAKTVSSVTVDKNEHRSSGGTSTFNISGSGLTYGVSAAVFFEGNATPITTMSGDDASQTATYSFPANVTTADQTYTIKFSVDGGVTYLDTPTAEVTVHSDAAPMFIVDLPESITAKATDSQVTLLVAVVGDYALNYQWYKNGVAVEGATENHLRLQKGDGINSYHVVVTDTVTGLSIQSKTCAVQWEKAKEGNAEPKSENGVKGNPKTGDLSNPIIWVSMLLLCAAIVVGIVLRKRKASY